MFLKGKNKMLLSRKKTLLIVNTSIRFMKQYNYLYITMYWYNIRKFQYQKN